MLGTLLFPVLALIFVVVAMTRPHGVRPGDGSAASPDPTAGIRDPARPF